MSGSGCEHQQVKAIVKARAACNRFFDKAERFAIEGDKAMFSVNMMGEYQFALKCLTEAGEQFTMLFTDTFLQDEFRDPALEEAAHRRQSLVSNMLWNEELMRHPCTLPQKATPPGSGTKKIVKGVMKNAKGETLRQTFTVQADGGKLELGPEIFDFAYQAGRLVIEEQEGGILSCTRQEPDGGFRARVQDLEDQCGTDWDYEISPETFEKIRRAEALLRG